MKRYFFLIMISSFILTGATWAPSLSISPQTSSLKPLQLTNNSFQVEIKEEKYFKSPLEESLEIKFRVVRQIARSA